MKRREFIALAGGAAATGPLMARAQQPAWRLYRIGFLAVSSREQQLHLIKVFEDSLRSRGYRVGENVAIEYRSVNGEMDRLPAVAAELVGLGVNIIIASSNPSTADRTEIAGVITESPRNMAAPMIPSSSM